jgi:hypothetical protein
MTAAGKSPVSIDNLHGTMGEYSPSAPGSGADEPIKKGFVAAVSRALGLGSGVPWFGCSQPQAVGVAARLVRE